MIYLTRDTRVASRSGGRREGLRVLRQTVFVEHVQTRQTHGRVLAEKRVAEPALRDILRVLQPLQVGLYYTLQVGG